MKKWWEIINKGSKRDQLSFIYISWKYNYTNFAFIERKLLRKYFKKQEDIKKHLDKNICISFKRI